MYPDCSTLDIVPANQAQHLLLDALCGVPTFILVVGFWVIMVALAIAAWLLLVRIVHAPVEIADGWNLKARNEVHKARSKLIERSIRANSSYEVAHADYLYRQDLQRLRRTYGKQVVDQILSKDSSIEEIEKYR